MQSESNCYFSYVAGLLGQIIQNLRYSFELTYDK